MLNRNLRVKRPHEHDRFWLFSDKKDFNQDQNKYLLFTKRRNKKKKEEKNNNAAPNASISCIPQDPKEM